MSKFAVAIICGGLIVASCGGSSPSGSSGGTKSTTSLASTSSGGSSATSSHGTASANMTVNGMNVAFSGGTCTYDGKTLQVTIGTAPTGTSGSSDYFGLTVGAIPQPDGSTMGQPVTGDGSFSGGILAINKGSTIFTDTGTNVTISGGVKQGHFSGSDSAGSVTGSFAC